MRVILPLSIPGIVSGITMVFACSKHLCNIGTLGEEKHL